MRKSVPILAGLACVVLLSGCGKRGFDRARPDEFAVARQAPLLIPADYSLVPPQPGAARPQDNATTAQTLDALFGGNTQRSAAENGVVSQAGGDTADAGIRSAVGDPGTNVVDKGATTRDIVAANMAELLEKADDPAKMIRMIISEMEDTLVEVRASAARTIADSKEMRRHIERLSELEHSWTEKAELALSKDREDLAKAALVERRKAGDMAQQLRDEVKLLDDSLRASEDDIAKLQSKLREARPKQNAIATRLESANTKARLRELWNGPKTHEACSRFELLERRADEAEGRAEAMGLTPKTLEDEFNELRSSDKIDAELAALKARMNKER